MKKISAKFVLGLIVLLLTLSTVQPMNTVEAAVNFTDIKKQQGSYNSITFLADKGWITGTSKSKFSEKTPLKRVDAAVWTVKTAQINTKGYKSIKATDIKKNHPAYPYVATAVAKEAIPNNSKIKPDEEVTRSEFSKIIVETFDFQVTTKETYSDVTSKTANAKYIATLQANGILGAKSKDKFQPNAKITRGEAAVALKKAYDYKEKITAHAKKGIFLDVNAKTPAGKDITWATTTGILDYYDDATFKPKSNVNRQVVAKGIIQTVNTVAFSTQGFKNIKATDVAKNNQYYPYFSKMVEYGAFEDTKKQNPNSTITRSEMAKAVVEGFDLKIQKGNTFSDVTSKTNNTHYISTVVATGIMPVKSKNNFKPNDKVTREEFAVLLKKAQSQKTKEMNEVTKQKEETPKQESPKQEEMNEEINKPSQEEVSDKEDKPVSLNIDFTKNYSKHEDIQKAFEVALSEYRNSLGLTSVQTDSVLAQAAGFRSWDMALNDYFSHVSPTYGGFGSVLEAFRPENSFGSEVITSMVIGRGAEGDARAALENFKSSPSHNEILLVEAYDKIGVGIDTNADGITTILTVIVSY